MKSLPLAGLAAAAASVLLLASACAPADDDSKDESASASTNQSCKVADLPLVKAGTLTVATDDPAYEPWFADNDPSNGQGFESAVAYAVADQLGFAKDDVTWAKVPFNTAYQPGKKAFDFDINQISITAERAKAVDFSTPYYKAAQAIITLEGSKYATAKTLDEFADAKLGAQIGTTSLKAIGQIKGAADPLVYDDTTKAAEALRNKQVDGIVADLPTAFYLTAAEIEDSVIAGQFQVDTGDSEEFGLLLAKDSKLTSCVDDALAALDKDGTLADLEQKWLSDSASAPVLQ